MEIDGLKQLVSTVSTKGVGSYDKSVMSTIEHMKQDIKTLHSKISGVITSSDEQAIQFYKLGFRSYGEASSWYETFVPSGNFGCVVDYHIVMKNIYTQWSKTDLLKKLEHIYKIKVQDISQATAMTSFETDIPKLLHKDTSGVHTIIKQDESYFNNV